VRKLFIPDEGYVIVDADLDRADLQVVVWEANDDELKQIIREGVNVHTENAKTIFGSCTEAQYKQAKAGVHATNYGAMPRTLAITLGITIKEAEAFQKAWFKAHPGIWEWRVRVEDSLQTTRMVRNRFGYRRYYFDRIESLLPEALAWIPQSTVANVINIGMRRVYDTIPEAELLIQVHDSIVYQCKKEQADDVIARVQKALEVTVPYDDPLVIGTGSKVSDVSWGDVA
jgi:DNA polymerase-1